MSSYRDERGFRVWPGGLPDYQLDPPAETTDELGLEDRCDACGAELCATCEGCTEGDREGCFACCVCEPVGIPADRWAAALDEAEDAAVDEAKVNEAIEGRS